jgi:hypothetical protein
MACEHKGFDPVWGQEAHASAITSRQHAKAVQLDLVNPAVASRGVRGWAGEARFDEARQRVRTRNNMGQ